MNRLYAGGRSPCTKISCLAPAALVCLAWWLSSSSAFAATITYVQGNSATPQTSQTSVTVTYTAAQAAGDLNVVAVGWNDSTATVTKVADKSGNSYLLAVGPTIQSGIATQSIYYAKNILPAAAGANIVTVTFSTAAVAPDIRILEYAGADPNSPVDVTAAGSGSSGTSSSGAATTTNATDLIFGANLVQTVTTGAGSGFTKRLLTSPDGDIAEDEMVTSVGSYSATAPLSSGQWIMQMVAFRTPSGGTTGPTVTSVSPNSGLTAGGTAITITGTNFAAPATVTIGGTAATNVAVMNGTTIMAMTPPGVAGVATVMVTVSGQSGSLATGFTYIGVPTVTSVSPNSGSTAGGTAVTITGTNFATGATVTFGTTAATNVVVVSSTSITSKTPAGTGGAVTVTVTNPLAQSGSLANGFTYAVSTTITYVQGNSATPQTSQTSVTVTYTAAQAAGDLIVVAVGWNDSTATVTKVADTSGNTYTLAVGPTIQSGVATQSIYYAKNIMPAAAGANIVTVTFSSAAVAPDIRILEYAGADPNNPVDVTAASSGSSATSSSGSATTTNATDLIFGANLVQTTTTGAGSGFTKRLLTSPDADIAEDEMVASIGSYSATAPLGSGQWIMQMVAFRTPSGGTTGPTVTSVSPNSGLTAGGTAVTITGTNFAAPATVTIGGTAATNVAVMNGTTIMAMTPPGVAGVATVMVTVSGQSGSLATGFTYIGVPTVTSVSPNSGPTSGGTAVTITGTNFATGATVTFGGTAATNVVVVSGTSITATTPAGSGGAVTVTVTNPLAQSGSLPSGFTYAVIPTVTSVSPNTGLTAGGTAVTITGANFAAPATVTIGGIAATNVVVVNSTSIAATTPPGIAGAATVMVTVSGQSGSLTSGFTYIGVPTLTSVSPNSGSTAGGTAVTITGTNFATGATVTFGTTAATNVVVVNSATVTATTPAGAAGAATVTVTNPLAQSGSLANGFTYAVSTTITYVQGNSATPQASQTSVTVTYTAAQAAGDLNVVAVGWNDSTATVTNVADKSGNSYLLAAGPSIQSGVASQSIYYAKNILPAAAGANVVTVTFSTAAAFPDIRILEYSGADANNPVDVTAASSGSSGTSSSGTATTTNATDLIFGANLVQTTTTGAGSGFTKRLLTSPDGDIAEDEMVTAIGSYGATATLSSGKWIMQMVAFRTIDPPPTSPTNLTAAGISISQINLSWTASTDNVGVTGYLVERCLGVSCSSFAQIGTSPTTTYSDTGLPSNTGYSYRVRATDADNNLSQYSNTATASTSEPTPTAPTSLSPVIGGPAPIVVSTQSLFDSTFVTSHTTAPFNSTGGNLIVLCASSHSGVILTPSDSYGNTWIPIAGPTNANAGGFDLRTQLGYAPNAIVGPGHTITMGLSTVEPLVMSVFVVQNSNISSPIDAVSLIGSDNGTGSVSVASPSITTSLSNDLLIGFSKVAAGTTFTAGAGFTLQAGASSSFLAAETAPAATVGTYQATFTLSAAQAWDALIAAVGYNSNQTTVSWTASTEVGGIIANYLIERCSGAGCMNFVQIGTTTGTTFNDIGMTGATSYSYRVRAQDTANTDGPYSTVASVTTPTPVPSSPSAPENLTTSGASVVAAQSLIDPSFSTTHMTAAFDSTGGNLIVLVADSLAGVTFTPSDSFGNTYIPIAGPTSTTTGSDLRTQLWYVQNPLVGPGHAITVDLSGAEPLVMSVIVVQGSNISSPIDVVSLIGSDNGTQTANVVSPSITTTGFNDLLIGFAKVSAARHLPVRPHIYTTARVVFRLSGCGVRPCRDAGNIRCDVHPWLKRKLAGRGGRCGQQSESNHAIVDTFGRTRRNRNRGNHQQLLSGASDRCQQQQRQRMQLCPDWYSHRHHLHRHDRHGRH